MRLFDSIDSIDSIDWLIRNEWVLEMFVALRLVVVFFCDQFLFYSVVVCVCACEWKWLYSTRVKYVPGTFC